MGIGLTVKNTWADPAGYEEAPTRIRYQIRDYASGKVEERETEIMRDSVVGRWFHSLHFSDQHFGNAIAHLTQMACAYFYEADDSKYEPLKGMADIRISDAEIRARIDRMNRGENLREALRVQRGQLSKKSGWYPLDQLPFAQQRALVEQIEALKRDWQFVILGESQKPSGDKPLDPEYGGVYG